MKTQIIIVIDEQKEKSTGKVVVFKNGKETERLLIEHSSSGNITVPEAAGTFSELFKDKFYKK